MKTNKQRIQWITGVGVLSALVIVLQFVSMALRFSTFSITLTLVPIVVGTAMYGIGAGGWLGFVFGLAVLLTGDAAPFLAVNIPGTIITVLAKGTLAGVVPGLVYKALEKKNTAVATVSAAVVSPIVNTGVFLLGCLVFFMDTIKTWAIADYGDDVAAYMFLGLAGINFVIELAINLVLSPTIVYIINIGKKHFVRKK
ncbi:MAG: ECF transporter S component [Clostridia bacterium]|nr:ECF transporter S component [Clostridia bacterium]